MKQGRNYRQMPGSLSGLSTSQKFVSGLALASVVFSVASPSLFPQQPGSNHPVGHDVIPQPHFDKLPATTLLQPVIPGHQAILAAANQTALVSNSNLPRSYLAEEQHTLNNPPVNYVASIAANNHDAFLSQQTVQPEIVNPRGKKPGLNSQPLEPADPVAYAAKQAERALIDNTQKGIISAVNNYEQLLDPVFKGTNAEVLAQMRKDLFGTLADNVSMHDGASGVLKEYIKLKHPADLKDLKNLVFESLLAYAQTTRQSDGSFVQYLTKEENGQTVVTQTRLNEEQAFELAFKSFGSLAKLLVETGSSVKWNNLMGAMGMSSLCIAMSDNWEVPTPASSSNIENSATINTETYWSMPDAPVYDSNFEVIASLKAVNYANQLKALTAEEIRNSAELTIVNFSVNQSRTLNLNGVGQPSAMLFVRDKTNGNIIPAGTMSEDVMNALIDGISSNGNININAMPGISFPDGIFYNAMFENGKVGAELKPDYITVKSLIGFDSNGNKVTISRDLMNSSTIRGIELRSTGAGGPAEYVLAFYANDGSGNIVFANTNNSMTQIPGNIHETMRHNSLNFDSPALNTVESTIQNQGFKAHMQEFIDGKKVTIDGIEYSPIVVGESISPESGAIGRTLTILPSKDGVSLPPLLISQANANNNYVRALQLSPEQSSMLGHVTNDSVWNDAVTLSLQRYIDRGGKLSIPDTNGNMVQITANNLTDVEALLKQNGVDVIPQASTRLGQFGSLLRNSNVLYSVGLAVNALTFVTPVIKAEINKGNVANLCDDKINCDLGSVFLLKTMTDMSRSGGLIYTEPTFGQIDVTALANQQQEADKSYVVFTMGASGYSNALLDTPVVLFSNTTATPYEVMVKPNDDPSLSDLTLKIFGDFTVEVYENRTSAGMTNAADYFSNHSIKTNIVDSIPSLADVEAWKIVPENYVMLDGSNSWQNKVVLMSFTNKQGQETVYVVNTESGCDILAYQGNPAVASTSP